MFEIGFPELILVAIVALLVIGPERLPEAMRTLGLWVGRMRRAFNNVRSEIEREIGMDEVRRQLHNEAVLEEMKRIEREVRASVEAGAARTSTQATPDADGGPADGGPAVDGRADSRADGHDHPGGNNAGAHGPAGTEPLLATEAVPADEPAAAPASAAVHAHPATPEDDDGAAMRRHGDGHRG